MNKVVKGFKLFYLLSLNFTLDVIQIKNRKFRFTTDWLKYNYYWLKSYSVSAANPAPFEELPRIDPEPVQVEIVQPKVLVEPIQEETIAEIVQPEPEPVIIPTEEPVVALVPAIDFFELFPAAKDLIIPLEVQFAAWNLPPTDLYYVACITNLRKPLRIFEFGTYNGATTYEMAKLCPDSTIFTIDMPPYSADFTVGSRFHNTPQADQIIQLYGDTTTYDYTEYLGTMDLVFVDADHRYEGVHSDSLNALKLVKPGGMIIWDDYSYYWSGVIKALNELLPQYPIVNIANTKLAVLTMPLTATP